jgi:hypothetical protein
MMKLSQLLSEMRPGDAVLMSQYEFDKRIDQDITLYQGEFGVFKLDGYPVEISFLSSLTTTILRIVMQPSAQEVGDEIDG